MLSNPKVSMLQRKCPAGSHGVNSHVKQLIKSQEISENFVFFYYYQHTELIYLLPVTSDRIINQFAAYRT